ncbi:MAG: Asp-tRNA(Asn)/Glu-tRNA(Gln) amidotransferase GatCAB subunit A, partial [Coriobacteriaceae bacterium]|nr:Asp-tRNA(Asn)/Glu-tRNA(Gln) amidotransferase GatCAB subunit A [Coriobacteriaceae bacterium]
MPALAAHSIDEIQAGLQNKEFTARELTESCLTSIETYDAQVKAFLEPTPDLAYEAADRIDESIKAGETLKGLDGIPIAFKDNMNQIGTHTTCASKMLESYVSPFDATCVANAVNAGAIPLGKTNMDEFAFGSSTETSAFGKTHNPWDLDCVPGGSSGGSAAAVAAGLTTVALGSDTGGSIRQPASFCGVVGLKPTYGVVSRYGVVAFGSSLDQVGPFARSVKDAALTLNAICGHDPLDSTSQECDVDFTENLDYGIEGMKIGTVPAFIELEGLTPEVKAAYETAVENLRGLGAEIVEVELPHVDAA